MPQPLIYFGFDLLYHFEFAFLGPQVVFYSQVIKNNLNPSWKSFNIPLQTLCSGDYDGPLRVITAVFYSDLLKKLFYFNFVIL